MAFSNRTIIQKINERANETVPSVAIVAQADCGHADFETASYAEPAEVRNMLLACERAAAKAGNKEEIAAMTAFEIGRFLTLVRVEVLRRRLQRLAVGYW